MATKSGPPAVKRHRQMEESLRRMKVSRMDLMQIHIYSTGKRIWAHCSHGRTPDAFVTSASRTTIPAPTPELERLMKTKDFDFAQFNYSIAERDSRGSYPAAGP